MQVLYANNINKESSLQHLSNRLLNSFQSTIDLYHVFLFYLLNVSTYVEFYADKQAKKLLAKKENQTIDTRLKDNLFIVSALEDKGLDVVGKRRKLACYVDKENIVSMFNLLVKKKRYDSYVQKSKHTLEDDREIILFIIKKIIQENKILNDSLESSFMHFEDDHTTIILELIKQTKQIKGGIPESGVFSIYTEIEQRFNHEITFGNALLKKTLIYEQEILERLRPLLKNWESDRVAQIDLTLLKMSLCEMLYFQDIPLRVTINEYIDIAKKYSTPKSKSFINGILDKAMHQCIQ